MLTGWLYLLLETQWRIRMPQIPRAGRLALLAAAVLSGGPAANSCSTHSPPQSKEQVLSFRQSSLQEPCLGHRALSRLHTLESKYSFSLIKSVWWSFVLFGPPQTLSRWRFSQQRASYITWERLKQLQQKEWSIKTPQSFTQCTGAFCTMLKKKALSAHYPWVDAGAQLL